MSLALNEGNWWECSGDKLWAMNLKQSNFVAQGDKCDRCGRNQVLEVSSSTFLYIPKRQMIKKPFEAFLNIWHQKRKHTIAIFRKVLSWKIIIQKYSQAGQFERVFLLYYTIEALLAYWSTEHGSVFHDRMPAIYRHLF